MNVPLSVWVCLGTGITCLLALGTVVTLCLLGKL